MSLVRILLVTLSIGWLNPMGAADVGDADDEQWVASASPCTHVCDGGSGTGGDGYVAPAASPDGARYHLRPGSEAPARQGEELGLAALLLRRLLASIVLLI